MKNIKTSIKNIIPEPVWSFLKSVRRRVRRSLKKEKGKYENEFGYWRGKRNQEGILSHDHYEPAYTTHFGLDKSYYTGKKVLDIGCGPRGSLEWADNAAERIGLDPLADAYQELGADQHAMEYRADPSENIPFTDGYFDVVCSFNSLDHVDDLDQTIREIGRVVKSGGVFLLLTDVNHDPTPTEPIRYSWDIVDKFTELGFDIDEEKHYEKVPEGLYQSLDKGELYDHSDNTERYGILSVKFVKK